MSSEVDFYLCVGHQFRLDMAFTVDRALDIKDTPHPFPRPDVTYDVDWASQNTYLLTFSVLVSLSRSEELRTQKLRSHLVRTQDLKRSPFKAWSRSAYSHIGYAYCQGFLPCLFVPFRSIHLHFFQNFSRFFSCVGCG